MSFIFAKIDEYLSSAEPLGSQLTLNIQMRLYLEKMQILIFCRSSSGLYPRYKYVVISVGQLVTNVCIVVI